MRVDSVNLDLFVFMNKSFLFLTLSITQHLKPEKNQQPMTCVYFLNVKLKHCFQGCSIWPPTGIHYHKIGQFWDFL